MAKASNTKGADQHGSAKTKLPANDPSNGWVENETQARVIDITDEAETEPDATDAEHAAADLETEEIAPEETGNENPQGPVAEASNEVEPKNVDGETPVNNTVPTAGGSHASNPWPARG